MNYAPNANGNPLSFITHRKNIQAVRYLEGFWTLILTDT